MNTMNNNTVNTLTKSPNRLVAVIFGAVYLLIGLAGFLITANVGFAATEGEHLLGLFMINPLHNIVHIVIGAVLLAAGLKSVRHSKTANATVGGVYLIVGIIGLFILDSSMNILALNTADNILHFLSALILLGVGLGMERNVPTTRTAVTELT
jgi:ABC-type Na+ efflux pump permease subunit